MIQKLRRSKGGPLWAIWKDVYTIKLVSNHGVTVFCVFSVIRVWSLITVLLEAGKKLVRYLLILRSHLDVSLCCSSVSTAVCSFCSLSSVIPTPLFCERLPTLLDSPHSPEKVLPHSAF